MNSLFISSIAGKDFLRYKMDRSKDERVRIAENVISLDLLPVVIDSLDETISNKLSGSIETKRYAKNHGKCFKYHKTLTIADITSDISNKLIDVLDNKVIKLGLENGKILKPSDSLLSIYNVYKSPTDNILYIIVTSETSVYGYITSILKYIKSLFINEKNS